MPATAPRPRSPAQIEAARRNGARSRGPVTAEGKARSSRNALKHGLAALEHFVLEDEAPSELEELAARLMAEVEPESEIEARLVKRMAIAFWKSERAERIEVALFDAAPEAPPAAGRLRVGGGRPADHLRPQALQRRARLPGPAGQGAVPLPQGAAAAAPRRARGMHGRTRARRRRRNPGARPHPPTTMPAICLRRTIPARRTPCRTNPSSVGPQLPPPRPIARTNAR